MVTLSGRRSRRKICATSTGRLPAIQASRMPWPGTRMEPDSSIEQSAHPQDSDLEGFQTPDWKRRLDLLVILVILPVALILAASLYLWIKLVSPGNVLFRQTRIGRAGKTFTIYKFRSMRLQAETAVHEAHVEHLIKTNRPMTKLDLTGDNRLIRGGCFMRMSGLDELPQLLNVLLGEMSLVGPRPCMPNEYRLYDSEQYKRFTVQPGLTGLWQVERTSSTTFREMVAMDDRYVHCLSPWEDLKILLKTPGALLKQIRSCIRAHATKTQEYRAIDRQSLSLGCSPYLHSMSDTRKFSD